MRSGLKPELSANESSRTDALLGGPASAWASSLAHGSSRPRPLMHAAAQAAHVNVGFLRHSLLAAHGSQPKGDGAAAAWQRHASHTRPLTASVRR